MQLFRGAKKSFSVSFVVAGLIGATQLANATTVQFQTVLGDFEVNLFDKTTPKTVENFLTYVNSGAYADSIMHRSVPEFIVQGGGFTYTGSVQLKNIAQNAAVINEPAYSNRRGTIAMAKVGDDPNSATTQWFFNLKDNSANLDTQNGGFTVFGQVTGNGMAIIDAMAALNRFNKTGALSELPLRNYTTADHTNNATMDQENFVMIDGIMVLDASPDTADGLNPVKNTSLNAETGGSGGGGGIGFLGILALSVLAVGRLCVKHGRRRRQDL